MCVWDVCRMRDVLADYSTFLHVAVAVCAFGHAFVWLCVFTVMPMFVCVCVR
jgi:hypothetical protein